MFKQLIALVGVAMGMTVTHAQSTWTPQEGIDNLPRGADVQQQAATLGWVFHPIVDGTQVTAFYAQLDSADAFGANIKEMYFLHGNDGTWTSYGWAESNPEAAVAWIRSQHGASALSRDAMYDTAPATTATPVAPAPMKGGIFVADPNAAIFDQMDPEARATLVGWLVDAGYAGSPKLAELLITEHEGGPKVLDELMNYLSNQAEYTLYPLKTTYASTSAAAWPCGCFKIKRTRVILPSPGVPMKDPDHWPNPRLTGGGQCIWRFRRATTTPTEVWTGEYFWSCVNCNDTAGTIWEYTEIIAPCPPAAAPTPGPSDPWWY